MVPDPFIVEPAEEHKQSMIVLHGRGDTGVVFGRGFLNTRLPSGTTMEDAMPNTKFIFPFGTMRIPVGTPMYQWYQLTTLTNPPKDQEMARRGLLRSSAMIHDLIREEADLVGTNNVILGGLSQGCATMLTALCLWNGSPIKAAFGMSGWFPYHKLVSETMEECEGNAHQGEAESLQSRTSKPGIEAVKVLREFMDLNQGGPTSVFETPMFLGHGDRDDVVAFQLGMETADCWKKMGCPTEWHAYQNLYHWYDGAELGDVLAFIQGKKP